MLLGVDYGDVRTGLAASDPTGFLASPAGLIVETGRDKLALRLAETAKSRGAEKIVLGLPLNMDGSEGERAKKCRRLAEKIEAAGVAVVLMDERQTTKIAHRTFNELNVRGAKRKSHIDEASAVIILQSYLDAERNKNQRI